ncbi:Small-conductance mechanosensitive channel [Marinobacterium lacunae]|uniref:Small-conductance mechanosensitive channel n=1 Tax=Marinobacterium lacunae TaxID=1232683 RepID=A0A081FV05_9GAMM|nr:mechanosensitive ion channel domain-containing protein [Marinobacterium lacunae]KEA62360.1 Small-conductance mechanosensitive channel [Marinobacterium lacunae]MBR9883727.1 mechanosensitive ion channel [Oceanospirillales bacterium]
MESFWDIYIVPWAINIALALAIFFVGRWLAKHLVNLIARMMRRAKTDEMLVNFVSSIVNVLLLLFIIVASLGQLGIDTTSLIALVGAAGLAIGLSLQDSLKNFAAGVLLIIFRPFKEGDFVEVAGVAGIVEHVAIFNTVMRTGDNREVIVPNGGIYAGVITNYSKRETRRVDMVFGISYDDDLRKAKDILKGILDEDDRILKDPAPVVAVAALADSSVNFNVRPWVKTADYWAVYWDVTEQVKLRFDEAGITIPYPQLQVHTNSASSEE